MPEPRAIVINTGPLIALTAACGNLRLLGALYGRVIVPFEVSTEVLACDGLLPGAAEFRAATWLDRRRMPCALSPLLRNALDAGEAAVIHTALAEGIGVAVLRVDLAADLPVRRCRLPSEPLRFPAGESPAQ